MGPLKDPAGNLIEDDNIMCDTLNNLPDNLPDKASPGETGSASRVTQTEIVYKVTHLYNVFPIAA